MGPEAKLVRTHLNQLMAQSFSASKLYTLSLVQNCFAQQVPLTCSPQRGRERAVVGRHGSR